MNTMQHSTRRIGRRQQGQGMTEYIIIVALVAIAAIAAFTFFGGTLRSQIGGAAQELAGESATTAIGQAKDKADAVVTEGAANKNMKEYKNEESR